MRSLRSRITSAATVAAFVGLAIGLFSLGRATESALVGRLHDEVVSDAQALAQHADDEETLDRLAAAVPPSHLVQIRAGDGTIVASSPHYVRQSQDLDEIELLVDPDQPPADAGWWSGDDDLSRLGDGWISASVMTSQRPRWSVTVAAPLADVSASVATVRQLGTLALFPLTAMSGLIVWLGLGRMLQPVERARRRAASAVDIYPPPRLDAAGGGLEIEMLVSTFDDLLQRTAVSARRQRMFFANAAHELLSPLSVLRTNLEVAQGRTDNADVTRCLDRSLGGQARLESLARQLLVLARGTELDRLDAVDVDLADVIDDVVGELTVGAAVDVTADLERPAIVTGDPSALRQLVDNLIANAIRHAHSSVEVGLTMTYDEVAVTIDDDGPGVPAEHREAIFEPFFRVEGSRSRNQGGAGLGLTIARSVVSQHGGALGLTDSELGGARFCLELPRRGIMR